MTTSRRTSRPTCGTGPRRLLALLPLLAVAACGQAVSDADDALTAGPSAPPDGLVLQVVRAGGFQPVGAAFRSVPSASVYGDGRVITEGPQIAIYPPPALPSVQVGVLDAAQVQRLVEQGREVVEADADYGQPPVADAPTTAVVLPDGDERQVAAAVALEELSGDLAPPDGGGLTAEQQAARERLRAYVRDVHDVASSAPAEPYDAEALAVLAEPYGDPAPVEGVSPEQVPWPGPALTPGECVVVTGDEQAAALEAAASASVETRWTSDGQVLRLAFRPLLPHERTCEDVQTPVVPPSA